MMEQVSFSAEGSQSAPGGLLTTVILARDEEQVLASTLDSARQVADQLLLADTGSQDRTRVVGYRYGAQVVQVPWEEDFAAARNKAIQQVRTPWILWLDAGEQVDLAAAAAMREFVRTKAEPAYVYWLRVILPPTEPSGCAMEVFQGRLMPNRPGLRFQGRIRESLQPAIEALGMQWAEAPGRILCHPRRHHPDWKAQRALRNLRIAHQENAGSLQPEVRLLLAMADCLVDLGDLPHAHALYRQAVYQAQPGSAAQLEAYYGVLTTSDTRGEAGQTLLAYAIQALEQFPLDAQLLCLLGQLLAVQGQWGLAARTFEQAFRSGTVRKEVWHLTDWQALAGWKWSQALDGQNAPESALAALEQVAQQTGAAWIRHRLVEKYIQLGRLQQAIEELSVLDAQTEGNGQQGRLLSKVVQGAYLATQKQYQAAIPLLEEAFQTGCRHPVCLHWLVAAKLNTGQAPSAEAVFREWQRVDPAHPELPRYGQMLQKASSRELGEDATPEAR